MKRKLAIAAVVVVVLLLLLPLSNLLGGPSGTPLARAAKADPAAEKVAAILEPSCAYCHVREVAPPLYAKLPVASSVVSRDVRTGLRWMDLVESLFPAGGPAAETGLAKLEHALVSGSMPPGRFLALHWNGGLSATGREAVLAWIRAVRAREHAPRGIPAAAAAEPVHPLPASVEADARKAALGEKLYHDKRLSGDDTVSCATCHDLAKGGTDQARVSTGVRGQKGGINAPTTFNAGFQFLQFWDGRAADLQAQAGGPPLNPVEMDGNWEAICAKLGRDEALSGEFLAVYPEGFSARTVTEAIAEFEKTLVTPNSRFDRFLAGDAGALAAEEKRGWEVFRGTGCAGCHVGKILGGRSFEVMGREVDYFARRGGRTDADNGRFNHTKDEADRGRFKVPTLRNVARTFPYFHDGSAATLEEAVRVMAEVQHGAVLTAADLAAVVKFLEALTGEWRGKPL